MSTKLNIDQIKDLESRLAALEANFTQFSSSSITYQPKFQYTTMPTSSEENVGDIIEYTGVTDSSYTNGYFYKSTKVTVSEATTESLVATQTGFPTANGSIWSMGDIEVDLPVFKSALNPTSSASYTFSYVGYPSVIVVSDNGQTKTLNRDNVFDNNQQHIYSWVDEANNYYFTNTQAPLAITVFYTGSLDNLGTPTNTDSGFVYQSTTTRFTTGSGIWVLGDGDTPLGLSDYGLYSQSNGYIGVVITATYTPQADAVYSYTWQQINVQPRDNVSIQTLQQNVTNTSNNLQTLQQNVNTTVGNIETLLAEI